MTGGAAMHARLMIAIFVVVSYALLAHIFSTVTKIPALPSLPIMSFAIVPLAVLPLAFALALKPALRKWSALLLGGAVLSANNPQWYQWSMQHLAWIYFAQDSALNAGLALLFGSTLRRGETPLCSRIAMLMLPQSSAQALRYTRAATCAWTAFFCAMMAVSTALFFCATHTTWSMFANLLYWPLLIAMFAIEYGVRVLVLPRDQRVGFFATIRTFNDLYGARTS